MKLVYIAGPYRAETPYGIRQNIHAAEQIAANYWQQGYAVICPHKNSSMMDGVVPDTVFLDGALEILRRCDAIVMCPGWRRSPGSMAEHRVAYDLGLEIIYEAME